MPPAAKSGWESDVPREVNPRRRTLGPNVALWSLLLAPGASRPSLPTAKCLACCSLQPALFFRWPDREVVKISVSQYGQRHMMRGLRKVFFPCPAPN